MNTPSDLRCPFCGRLFSEHSEATMIECHIAWLADPDRTAGDVIIYMTGAIKAISTDLRSGASPSAIAAGIDERAGHLITATARIIRQKRATERPGPS